jgi:hypothetical protein
MYSDCSGKFAVRSFDGSTEACSQTNFERVSPKTTETTMLISELVSL